MNSNTNSRRWVPVLVGFGMFLSSCGAESSGTASDASSSAFVGTFDVTGFISGGQDVPLTGPPAITVDDVTASVSVDTGCNTHLGSYSFFDDGRISLTFTGGTRRDCEAALKTQDDLIITTLGEVENWTSPSSTSLSLSTPDGDVVDLEHR